MDTRLQTIKLHDCLQGFMVGCWAGTSTSGVKLLQELASLEQALLSKVFIDLKHVYDVMDWSCCIKSLRGNGMGPNPNLIHLLSWMWRRWSASWEGTSAPNYSKQAKV